MITFQHTGKADSRRKLTGLLMLGLCVYVGITGWKIFSANGMLLTFALGALVVALIRGLDPFLSRPVLKIDETALSQSGHLWPLDNWKLKWETVTQVRLFGQEAPTLIVLDTAHGSRFVTDFESFDQVIQLIREQLEKRGRRVERIT